MLHAVGCNDKAMAPILKELCQADFFRVVVVDDRNTVEICGALKVGILMHFQQT